MILPSHRRSARLTLHGSAAHAPRVRAALPFAVTLPFAVALSFALALFGPTALPAYGADLTLRESGSTLLYPLFQHWVPDYVTAHPGITITTSATGSGAGIDQASTGQVQIGASDAYMSDEQAARNPQI